jgi:hypothetical protein
MKEKKPTPYPTWPFPTWKDGKIVLPKGLRLSRKRPAPDPKLEDAPF